MPNTSNRAKPTHEMVTLSIQELRSLHDEICEITDVLRKQLTDNFPVGTEFTYRHGEQVRSVEVVDHSPFGRLKVRGLTGKEYWLDYTRLIFSYED